MSWEACGGRPGRLGVQGEGSRWRAAGGQWGCLRRPFSLRWAPWGPRESPPVLLLRVGEGLDGASVAAAAPTAGLPACPV